MRAKFLLILLAAILVVVIGGATVLAFWEIPAPTGRVEKVVPNERLNK